MDISHTLRWRASAHAMQHNPFTHALAHLAKALTGVCDREIAGLR
ncbi:hypothetical protein rerp_60150 [Rhodococcus erythropolis]|nr:hypothetical protein rerp_60150 [Rhodococcus erythropolis]